MKYLHQMLVQFGLADTPEGYAAYAQRKRSAWQAILLTGMVIGVGVAALVAEATGILEQLSAMLDEATSTYGDSG